MYGWTEFDLVKIEQGFKEERLRQAAMMPMLTSRRPIRSKLASTLMTLAQQLSPEQMTVPPSTSLAIGTER
ncbi:MAG TPA: hypothetical protein VF201_15610 [Nitrolancea sp.]